MQRQHESIEVRRERLGLAIQQLAADLVDERRRRVRLEREVKDLRSQLAAYEPNKRKENPECQPLT